MKNNNCCSVPGPTVDGSVCMTLEDDALEFFKADIDNLIAKHKASLVGGTLWIRASDRARIIKLLDFSMKEDGGY